MGFLSRFEPQCYALLRIVAGLLFIFHGLQKFGMYGDTQVELASIYGAAAIIEVTAGTLIMIGLAAAPLAFLASGEMAYAYFMQHQPKGTWPIQNGGELAALYAFIFLYIAARGSGSWSVDGARSGGARKYRSR